MSTAQEGESEAQMTSKRCEHDDELLALGAMRLLSTAEEAQLAARLESCPACQQRLEEYRALSRAMPRLIASNAAPSPVNVAQKFTATNHSLRHLKRQATSPSKDEEPEQEIPARNHPYPLRPGSRLRRQQRLWSAFSGLAAVLLLAVLLVGFRWLIVGRGQSTVMQPAGCLARTNAGQASAWQCGILVFDGTTTHQTLVPLDPRTGHPLPGLKPLPVGNVVLSAITSDRRTLVLAISPTQNNSAVYLQVVWLNQWKLGPQIKTGHYVDALTISDDGQHIYVVMPEYSNGMATIWLQSYLNQPKGIQASWRATLPFVPNSDGFAVSRDGATLYAFTEKTSPAQIMQAHMGENGLESIQSLPLNELASGADSAASAVPYTKGDPIPAVYHPAVIFSPDRTMLYLVYAPSNDPTHDRLLTLYLLKWSGFSDLPITEATQTLADLSPASASPFSSLARSTHSTSLASTTTPFNGRSEHSVISPDGQWLYVTGKSQTAQIFSDGTWRETTDYLGLWKINAQNGKVAGQWFPGDTFNDVHMSGNGQTLYLFNQPTDGAYIQKPASLLAFSTQTQQYTPLLELQFQERVILAP